MHPLAWKLSQHICLKTPWTYTCIIWMRTRLLPPCSSIVPLEDCALPLKVLWAVISKTIPWMAALIENNEGHIEHMVAVVSPFSPFLSLAHTYSVSLSLPNSPTQKVRSNFAPVRWRSMKTKGRCQSCSFFFPHPSSFDKLMSTQAVRGARNGQSVGGKMLTPLRRAVVGILA